MNNPKKYLIISGAALVCIVILVILVQSLLFRKSGGSSSSPMPTPVSGSGLSRTTGKTEDTSFRFQSSSSRASDSGASQSSTSSKNQETARKQMDAVKKLLPVVETKNGLTLSYPQDKRTSLDPIKNLGTIETDDFILAYSPNLDRLVVTRKTPQADEAFAQWALSQGYPALVDNYQTTIVSDKTMEEVQTPYVTKSPEETMTGMLNLFSALFRTPSFPEETPVPPSPTPKVESSSSEPKGTEGEYVYYSQCQGAYDNYPLTEDCTLCNAGCGPTTAAMILSSFVDKKYTPPAVVDIYKTSHPITKCNGTVMHYLKNILKSRGIKTSDYFIPFDYNKDYSIDDVRDDIKAYTDHGWTVFILARFHTDKKSGHFFWITGIDAEGNVLAYDPYYGKGQAPPINQNRRYPLPRYVTAFAVKK